MNMIPEDTKADIEGATPVMAQYIETKTQYPDALLFFRMGDFYELFFEDAVTAAQALSLALTKRGKYRGEDIPLAGVPAHGPGYCYYRGPSDDYPRGAYYGHWCYMYGR